MKIDGQPKGATPLSVQVSAGTHVMELSVGGEPRVIPLTVNNGEALGQYSRAGRRARDGPARRLFDARWRRDPDRRPTSWPHPGGARGSRGRRSRADPRPERRSHAPAGHDCRGHVDESRSQAGSGGARRKRRAGRRGGARCTGCGQPRRRRAHDGSAPGQDAIRDAGVRGGDAGGCDEQQVAAAAWPARPADRQRDARVRDAAARRDLRRQDDETAGGATERARSR